MNGFDLDLRVGLDLFPVNVAVLGIVHFDFFSSETQQYFAIHLKSLYVVTYRRYWYFFSNV